MFSKLRLKKLSKKQLKIVGLVLLLLALPLTLSTLYFIQDNRSRAALPNQLESEAGVLSSSGVNKQSDSGASGGQYVKFTKSTSGPTPTPSQGGLGPRPAPSEPTQNVYIVPNSIDGTGNTEVSSQLLQFINSVPNGSNGSYNIIRFPAGKIYRLNYALDIQNKSYITFWGYETSNQPKAKLIANANAGDGLPGSHNRSVFRTGIGNQAAHHIKFLGFEVEGRNSKAGTYEAAPWTGNGGNEAWHFINSWGAVTDIEVADTYVHNMYSDAISILPDPVYFPNNQPDRWSIHHNRFEGMGRQGISTGAGDDHSYTHNIIRDAGLNSIDFEDSFNEWNGTVLGRTVRRLNISDNLFENWAWGIRVDDYLATGNPSYGNLTNWNLPSGVFFFAGAIHYTFTGIGQSGIGNSMSISDDIKIERNLFKGGPRGIGGLEFARCNTHQAAVMFNPSSYKTNLLLKDNRFEMLPELQCAHGIKINNAHGLGIINNYLPGMAIEIKNSTGLNQSGNTTSGIIY
jgi:hypothetical protein